MMSARAFTPLFIVATALLAVPGASAAVHVSGAADTLVVAPGEVFTVDIVIPQADSPFNAFGLGLHFDPSHLTFVPAVPNKDAQRGPLILNACTNTFHVFSATADSLKVELSLLCNQVSVTGPGVLYRVRFQAGPADAITRIDFGPSTRFILGGAYQSPILTTPIVVRIGSPVLDAGIAGQPGSGVEFSAPSPNPARARTPMTLRFTLRHEGLVSFDLFDALGRRVAQRAPQTCDARPQTLSWELPALAPGRYSVLLRTSQGDRLTRGWAVLR